MKKLSKITLTILKLSFLVFVLSFIGMVFGMKVAETSAGISFASIVVFTMFFVVFKFSSAISSVFSGVAGLFKKS